MNGDLKCGYIADFIENMIITGPPRPPRPNRNINFIEGSKRANITAWGITTLTLRRKIEQT